MSPEPWGSPLFRGGVQEEELAKELEKEQPERWEESKRGWSPGSQRKEVFQEEGNQGTE